MAKKPDSAKLFPTVRTGVKGLDDILCGGLPRNRIYLLQGDPGVGKTTLALQFLLEGRKEKESVLYITLSETRNEIEAVAHSHGWSLEQLSLFELSGSEAMADTENTLFHPDEVELHETTKTLLDEVERVKPTRVVFDSLSEMRLLAQSALRYRRQILALKQYFSGRNCTVLLIDDRTSEPGGDQQLQSLAHGVILLEQRTPEYGSDRRRLRVVKMRGVKFRGGYHDFNIEPGGLQVFPRLVASEHQADFLTSALGSGVAQIDSLLGGGIDRGTATLIIGPAGSGKSALATQFAVASAAQDEKVAMFLFDEGKATLFARARSLGMPLQEEVKRGRITAQQIDPAELSPGEFSALIRRSIDEDHARLVIIDSLNGFLQSMPADKHLNNQMHEMLSYLRQVGVSTIMVMAQHGMIGPMASPVDMSYLADTVVMLRYFEAKGTLRKAISVLKKRSGAHENTIRDYSLGKGGITVGEPLKGFQGVLTGVPHLLDGALVLEEKKQK